MWCSGKVSQYTTELWTAGLSIPIDSGERQETPTGRKLRPIILAEVLPKFAEAVGLDECSEDTRNYFDPDQLGVGTPYGNIILLRALQSWSQEMEEADAEKLAAGALEELEAVMAMDLTNAYGRFYRFTAIAEIPL